jgi:ell wall binding domain 2 (CWB2)
MPAATSAFVTARRDQFGGWTLYTAGGRADRAAALAFGAVMLAGRFAGPDRYATAAAIAEGIFTDAAGALVGDGAGLATGQAFPDGLSASATLALSAKPLLLTRTQPLSNPTATFLTNHAGEGDFLDVFGGTTTVSAAAVTAAETAFTGEGPCATLSGPILDLNTGLTGQAGPDTPVVYNHSEGEFLVAWNQGLDVFARRVGADGSLPGAPITVMAGPDAFFEPALAYHPVTNQYFISWQFQGGGPGSPDFNNAFGRLLSATGEPDVGEVVHVSNAAFEPTVGFNPVTGEYFHHARNFAGGGVPGLLLRRIDALGQPLGEPIQIVPFNASGEAEVNPLTGQILSIRREDDLSDPVLRGRRLSPTGTPVGSSFVIADLFPSAVSVAFDPDLARYLVVFSTLPEPPPVLHAQLVSAQGTLIGPRLTLVENAHRSQVAYDPINQLFLVTWWAEGSGLWAQPLSPQGTPLGEPLNVAAGSSVSAPTGGVAANVSNGGFLVSWSGTAERVAARLVAVSDC